MNTALSRIAWWGLLLGTLACASYELWPETEEFLGRLRCGMSESEVAAVANTYPDLEFKKSRRGAPWDWVAYKPQTSITLDFEEGSLRRAEVTWVDAILHAEALPIREFCSDEVNDHSLLKQPADLSDPTRYVILYLAGRPVGQVALDTGQPDRWQYVTTDHLGTTFVCPVGSTVEVQRRVQAGWSRFCSSNGVREGAWEAWSRGRVVIRGGFEENAKHGTWIWFDSEGARSRVAVYRRGEELSNRLLLQDQGRAD